MPLKLPSLGDRPRGGWPTKPPAREKPPARPKPKPIRERARTRKKRASTAWVRPYVFKRERDVCRLCGPTVGRMAESRHEITSRGAGGQISPENAIAVCGQLGTTGCHGFAQTRAITIREDRRLEGDPRGAEGSLLVTPTTKAAAAWLNVPIGQTFVSRPLYVPFCPEVI